MATRWNRIDTRLIHSGEPVPLIEGAVMMPIFQSATYEYREDAGFRYTRLNNTPNHAAVAAKLAAIENAEDAVVTASGMAAITASLLTFLAPGDHILTQEALYGGTYEFIARDLTRLGIGHDFIDHADPSRWSLKLKPSTKVIFVEAMTNPLLEVADLKAVATFAREHALISMIDNTFASPVNFRPMEWGFDLSIHSCTKYLNGHSDVLAGAVAGGVEHLRMIKSTVTRLGGSLDPHACYLLYRGMKTLALRVRAQNRTALLIAQFLEDHPGVEKVNYPGLGSHPDHGRATHFFDGFGGMVSFEPRGGTKAAERFMGAATIPTVEIGRAHV